MENVKNALIMADVGNVIMAPDIMDPIYDVVYTDEKISEVYDRLMRYEFLPVLNREDKVVGILDYRQVKKYLSSRLVELSKKAFN